MTPVPAKITVCIVTCNQRAYIAECIQSVLEQVVDADINILIGDDASEDGTSEIVAKLTAEQPAVVTHLLRSPRMGPFANMRDLMERAGGDFIARLDGDDFWLPGKLKKQLDYMLQHPDCAAVYTNAITVDHHGTPIGEFNDAGNVQLDLASLLRSGNFLNNSSILFRHSGRRAWLEAETQIDYRLHLWHARHGHLGHLGEPLVAYRVNAHGSLVKSREEYVRKLYWEAVTSVPRNLVNDEEFAHGLGSFLRKIWFRALRLHDFNMAKKWTNRILEASPSSKTRTLLFAVTSSIHAATKAVWHSFDKDAQGKRIRVLHRR